MSLLIRLADNNDAALIAEISRQTFYDTFAAFNTEENMEKFMREQFSKKKLVAEVGEPGNIFLLAFLDNEPVGYVRLRTDAGLKELGNVPAAEIARIYAVKQAIGKGIGAALMERSVSLAKDNNAQLVWLGVWEHNYRAIEFYTRWGFEKFGEHDFVVGNDVQTDWLMKRAL